MSKSMRKHLFADFETSKKDKDKPVFHKIVFNKSSIYLTKAYFFEAGNPVTGRNSLGDYRLFSWADLRAKEFLGFELGQKSPLLGKARLIGSFTPIDGDLRDVKYASYEGKAFFKSALSELNGHIEQPNSSMKIDADHLVTMKEIIPTGVQGKAIYGEGNYIIDGAAGTGKSTTVLQKLKLLQLHNNVKCNKIAIIVKNTSVVPRFKQLLSSIGLEEISIFTVERIMYEVYRNHSVLTEEKLLDMERLSQRIFNAFETVCNIQSLTSFRDQFSSEKFEEIINLVHSQRFKIELEEFIRHCKRFKLEKIEKDKEISDKKDKIISESEKDREKSFQKAIHNKKIAIMRNSNRSVDFSKIVIELSLAEETEIRDKIIRIKNSKLESLNKENTKFKNHFSEKLRELTKLKSELVKSLLDNVNAFGDDEHQRVLELYLEKCFKRKSRFHTVIIDEAQDVNGRHIELVRLVSENTILTGDELQKENKSGIGSWDNLVLSTPFVKNGKLNLFELRHNFRQTYELGIVSYNYRQLLLGREINDIRADYYEDQIGFEKPKLVKLISDSNFVELVQEKISYIAKRFTKKFPLVIFYEDDEQLRIFSEAIMNKVKYEIDPSENASCDVVFVRTQDIAGREFPVVMAPINSKTNRSTLYIILSRAKFSLCLFTKRIANIDKHISTLCLEGFIEKI